MRALVLVLIFVMASMNGIAQTNVFFKAYDYDYHHNFGDAIVQKDNSYYLCGYISSPIFSAHILKLDSNANMQWEDTIKLSTIGITELTVLLTIDDWFYSFGSFHDTSINSGNIFMSRFDSIGTINLIKTVDVCFNDRPIATVTDSPHIYLSGKCMDTAHTMDDLFLAKIDTGGNIVWKQEYDYSIYENPKSLDRTPDGGFIIGGEWFNISRQEWELFLLKTDSLGNEEWHKNYGNVQVQRTGYAITTIDGGFALAGYRNVAGVSKGVLIKTNSQGDVLWERLYGAPNKHEYFHHLKQDLTGNYILAGTSSELTPQTPKAWLSKLDPQGDTIWNRYFTYYGTGTHTYAEDLILTSDGGYAMTGYTLGPVPTRNDLWVLKTDSLGRTCDSPPCHAVLWDTQTAVLPLPAPALATLAPNPTTGQLTLTLASPLPREAVLTVYDVQGRTRRQWRLPPGQGQYTVYLGLPTGLYVARMEMDGEAVMVGKVVVE